MFVSSFPISIDDYSYAPDYAATVIRATMMMTTSAFSIRRGSIGALIIRIRFGVSCTITIIRNPHNSVGKH